MANYSIQRQYHARTKARISSDVLGPKNNLRSPLAASNSKKIFWGSMPHTPLAPAYTLTLPLGYWYR